ncbi:hypothetical protein HDU67_006046, partial [Dinochytrium kinnereticum]
MPPSVEEVTVAPASADTLSAVVQDDTATAVPPSSPSDEGSQTDAGSVTEAKVHLEHRRPSVSLPADFHGSDKPALPSDAQTTPCFTTTITSPTVESYRITPEELFEALTHKFLETLVIDVSATRSGLASIPGARRIPYILRVRSRIERAMVLESAFKPSERDGGRGVENVGVVGGMVKRVEEDVGNGFARVELPPITGAWDDDDDDDSDSDDGDYDDDEEGDPMVDPKDHDGDSIMTESPQKPRLQDSTRTRKQLLETLDYAPFSARECWDLTQISDVCFHRRIDLDVVVYDEIGSDKGFAAAFAETVRSMGRSRS